MIASVAEVQEKVAQKGSRDTARYVGRALFLHTPDGFGRSELATLLTRAAGRCRSKGARARPGTPPPSASCSTCAGAQADGAPEPLNCAFLSVARRVTPDPSE